MIGSTAIFTALSFCSSAALYLAPLKKPKGYDVHSVWVCWALLFVVCLIGRRSSPRAQQQQYELLEAGSDTPRRPNSTKECLGIPLLAVLSVAAVVAGVLANTQISQYFMPALVVVTTIICFTETSDQKSISLKPEGTESSSPAGRRLSSVWSISRLLYNIIVSFGVAVALYQNAQSSPDLVKTGLGGVGFFVCMAGTYASVAYSANVDSTFSSDEADPTQSTDWKLATRISAQAFCLATALVAFLPYDGLVLFDVFISGILQAVRWASVYQLATSGSIMISSTSQLAALGFAQAFLLQQNIPSGLFAASIIVSAVVMCFITLPISERTPIWGTCLIMAMPFLTLPMSVFNLQASLPKLHPIEELHMKAQLRVEEMVSRQSKTVEEAITEYRRRYRRDPPEGFDIWAELALEKGLLLIDEFDLMTETFEPYRRIDPSVLARWVEETVAQDREEIVAVKVENGDVTWDTSRKWAFFGVILKQWLTADPKYKRMLSNMTILLNTYDAPRVTVDRATLLGDVPSEVQAREKATYYSFGEHGWANMTASCPVDSPARSGSSNIRERKFGFITDRDNSLNICQHPEYEELHSMFITKAGEQMSHQLVPIWGQDRPSTFQDILYPSPYYEQHRSDYNNEIDSSWEDKDAGLYWAGSSTGGFNTKDNWRRMHRTKFVLETMPENNPHKITLLDQASPTSHWTPYPTDSSKLQNLFHTNITNVVQCDETACAELKETFPQGGTQPLSASYDHKYVLDMDGNGFSGRFYRLLRSRSAVIKQTILKEWHDDWLVPWIHYIPLSMEGDEVWEMMRFLSTTKRGDEIGAEIAMRSSEWSERVLRQVDMDLITLRMAIEYAALFKRT